MNQLGVKALQVDYVTVDTERVPRRTFAEIIEAWRDGYSETLAEHSEFTVEEVRGLFDHAIGGIMDPQQYAVWQIPIVSGHKA